MIIALGLLVAVAVIGYGAPRYLSVTVAPGLHPRLALTAWTASATLMLAAIVAAPVSMFTNPGRTAFGAAHACLRQLRQDGSLPWIDAAQVVLTGALGAIAAYLAVALTRRMLSRRRSISRHMSEVRLIAAAHGRYRGVPVLWVDAPGNTCYSVGGRTPAIVAGRNIADLPAAERDAVLDHEVAHLHGRHHLLVTVADALAAALPMVPLLRQAPDAVRTLVEFAADHRSADHHGPETVGAALVNVHAQSGPARSDPVRSATAAPGPDATPAMALALSRDAVTARLCWLSAEPNRPQRMCARVDYPLAVVTALAPLVVSVATMLSTAALVCLQLRG